MIPIVSPDTMRALEQTVMDGGISESELIRRAAAGMAGVIDRTVVAPGNSQRSILALAGPGNNGVDALVVAALLAERGWRAVVVLVDRPDLSGIPVSDEALSRIEVVTEIPAVDVVLDGIFGNSGRTDLPVAAVDALAILAEARQGDSPPLVVAVDCPTGTNTETGEVAESIVGADLTLCVSSPKIGMLRSPALEQLGELIVIDIGVATDEPDSDVRASLIDLQFARKALPPRPASAHKSQVGGLLIVGGAPGYYGAPRLAGEAALRAGCGYVGMAIPRSVTSSIATAVPELIFHPTTDSDGRRSASTVREALSDSTRYDAVVIGPGLGRDEVATSMLANLLRAQPKNSEPSNPTPQFGIPRRIESASDSESAEFGTHPLILDADALNWLSEQDGWPSLLQGRQCILTPHIGEMARLLGIERDDVASDPWRHARSAASAWGQVVVLKGPLTCVATPDGDVFVSPRSAPELATPGTGDVLAGLIGAFVAQGVPPAEAAALGVFVGAMAGRNARIRFGVRSVIARDLASAIPEILRELESPGIAKHAGTQWALS